MATRKYVSLNKLSVFLDKLKTIFAYKADLNDTIKQLNNHTHNDVYYTKTEIDNIELISIEDIDTICNSII